MRIKRGGALFATAIALAFLTHRSVRDQSVLQYRIREWPPARTWRAELRELGYEPLTDPKLGARLLQTFTPDFAAEPAVFASEDACLIHLEATGPGERKPELWACAPRPDRPRRWNRIGTGWYAFQNLPKPARKAPKPSNKLSNPIDPLEIRY